MSKKIRKRILEIDTLEGLALASPFVSMMRPTTETVRCEAIKYGSNGRQCKMKAKYVYQTALGPQKVCIHHVYSWLEYDRWETSREKVSAARVISAVEKRLSFARGEDAAASEG